MYADMTNWTITPMLASQKWEIEDWTYPPPYDFYNRTIKSNRTGDADAILSDAFAVLDENGRLVGHYHFGEDAHIPTEEHFVYTPDRLDIGLGLRPDLCGNGLGVQFIQMGLAFAEAHYGTRAFRLSVAAFNRRAITTYEHAGFAKVAEVTNSYFKNRFYIMVK